MRLNLSSVPAIEPVTLAEVKLHLRIDGGDEDALLTALNTAARQRIESYVHRALITQSWEMILDETKAEIEIPLPPLQAVTKIEVLNETGTKTEIDKNTYLVDIGTGQPGRVKLKDGCVWSEHRGFASFIVTFKAGYGDAAASVPGQIKEAIKQFIAHIYRNRGDVEGEKLPATIETLLWPYRVFRL